MDDDFLSVGETIFFRIASLAALRPLQPEWEGQKWENVVFFGPDTVRVGVTHCVDRVGEWLTIHFLSFRTRYRMRGRWMMCDLCVLRNLG